MSDSRRSGRSKKSIDYGSFGGDDSDGDFADPTPPPPKRLKKDNPKSAKKLEKKPRERNRKDTTSSKMSTRKERLPLDDKLFDRDLELAMELSKQDPQSSSQESEADQVQYMGNRQREVAVMVHSTVPEPEEKIGNQPVPDPLRPETDMSHNEDGNKENMADKEVHITSKTKTMSPIKTNNKEEAITSIETLGGSDVERGGRRQRKAASVAVAKQREMMCDEDNGAGDDDKEFKADDPENNFDASSSDDDYDSGDAHSDFEGSKATSKKKKGKSPKAASAEKKTPKARGGKKAVESSKAKHLGKTNSSDSSGPKVSVQSPVTPTARRPQPKGMVRGFTPPTMSTGSGSEKSQQASLSCSQSAVRRPGWSSPTSSIANNPLGGVKLVSPSQPLRLGLSRHARVKPLHANAKVP